jgi:hypothetical protein
MRPVRVCLVHPPGYAHSEAFREIAEALHYSLLRLGMDSAVEENRIDAALPTIVLGAHLDRTLAGRLPASAIVYNLEQLTPDLFEEAPHYRSLLAASRVWDFAAENAARYASFALPPPRAVVPPGPVPEWVRVAHGVPQDIDVLFYGSLNPRRVELLRAMAARGIGLKVAFGAYGPLRDALIARAKLVLNLRRHDLPVFEIVRVGYLLANRVAVVAESVPDSLLGADLAGAIARAEAEALPDLCAALLADGDRRRALAEAGRVAFDSRDFAADLARALGVARPPGTRPYPTRIDLRHAPSGSNALRLGAVEHADAAFDPATATDWPVRLDTARFGRFPLCPSLFESIELDAAWLDAHPAPVALERLVELLKPGGALCVYGPSPDESRFRAASAGGHRLERAQNVSTVPEVWWKVSP